MNGNLSEALRRIPENDPRTLTTIRQARTIGCFQIESPVMRDILRRMMVTSIEDVTAALALVRPGPSESGMKDVYLRRGWGLERVTYPHPSLEPVLKETYGVILYQEQVMQTAQCIAGFTPAEADLLRRAMTKDRGEGAMEPLRDRFFAGTAIRGLAEPETSRLWNMLRHFCCYCFNKGHGTTYGRLAYQSAFLKTYFPVAFMSSCLNNAGGFYFHAEYAEEARRLHIPLFPPDVNHADVECRPDNAAIRAGLMFVRNLTRKSRNRIVQERKRKPFTDLSDCIVRCDLREHEIRNLIKCGGLRSIHRSEPVLLAQTTTFFRTRKHAAGILTDPLNLPPFTTKERLYYEIKHLGMALTMHPLGLFDTIASDTRIITSDRLDEFRNKTVRVAGRLVFGRSLETRRGGYMKFLTMEDRGGLFDCILFPNVYSRLGYLIGQGCVFIVEGKVQSTATGANTVIVEKLEDIESYEDRNQ